MFENSESYAGSFAHAVSQAYVQSRLDPAVLERTVQHTILVIVAMYKIVNCSLQLDTNAECHGHIDSQPP